MYKNLRQAEIPPKFRWVTAVQIQAEAGKNSNQALKCVDRASEKRGFRRNIEPVGSKGARSEITLLLLHIYFWFVSIHYVIYLFIYLFCEKIIRKNLIADASELTSYTS